MGKASKTVKRVAGAPVVGALLFVGGRLAVKHLKEPFLDRLRQWRNREADLSDVTQTEPEPESKILGVTGEPKVGGNLSILHNGEFVFLWQRAELRAREDKFTFADIPDADSSTYTCQLEDDGKVLRVVYQRPQSSELNYLYINGGQPLEMDASIMQKIKNVPLAMFDVDVHADGSEMAGHQLVLCPKFMLLKSPARILCQEKYKTWPQRVCMCSHDQRAVFTVNRAGKVQQLELQFQSRRDRDKAVYLWHSYYSASMAKALSKSGVFKRSKSVAQAKAAPPPRGCFSGMPADLPAQMSQSKSSKSPSKNSKSPSKNSKSPSKNSKSPSKSSKTQRSPEIDICVSAVA